VAGARGAAVHQDAAAVQVVHFVVAGAAHDHVRQPLRVDVGARRDVGHVDLAAAVKRVDRGPHVDAGPCLLDGGAGIICGVGSAATNGY